MGWGVGGGNEKERGCSGVFEETGHWARKTIKLKSSLNQVNAFDLKKRKKKKKFM